MKRIIVIFTLIIAATLISHAQMKPDKLPPLITDAIAGPPVMLQVGGGVPAIGTDYSDILFYFNCNSDTTDQSPQKGSGTISIGANVETTTGAVDNALLFNGGWRSFSFQVTDNINLSVGTAGFFINWTAAQTYNYSNTILYKISGGGGLFGILPSADDVLRFSYVNATTDMTVNRDTTYFLEVAWDLSNGKSAYRINGGSWTERTDISGSTPTATSLGVGSVDGTTNNFWIDQLMISDVYKYDLYSIRTNTDIE